MELCDLLNCLQPVAHKWYLIGIELNLSPNELEIIKADSAGVEECLRRLLQKWYDRKTNPAWEEVIPALRMPALGEERLAQELEYMFITKETVVEEETCEVVKRNLAKIKGSFAALVTVVAEKLKAKNINREMFHVYMVTLFPHGSVLSSAIGGVAKSFKVVSQHKLWDYLNYTAIEEISKEFGRDDPELRELISNYKSELAGFKATSKIINFISACCKEEEADLEQFLQQDMARYDKHYCHKLTIKLKAKVTEKSLDYIDQFWRSIADHFLLPSLSVLLDSIQEGCIEVTWLVPTLSALQIKANIQESTEFFKKREVLRVVMEDEILYDKVMDERLIAACEDGNVDEVAALLIHGMSVDTTSSQHGVTALLVAARTGNLPLAEMLLEHHANVNKQDCDGYTPLMVATLNGHLDIVQLLLQYHPNIDIISEDGWTALCLACEEGSTELISMLLQHKAGPNVYSKNLRSPLMHVIFYIPSMWLIP